MTRRNVTQSFGASYLILTALLGGCLFNRSALATGELPDCSAIDTHVVSSTYTKHDYRVQVLVPKKMDISQQRYPVVYVGDASFDDVTSDMLRGVSRLIHTSGADAPPFILVTIGYPGSSELSNKLKTYDFTWPGYPVRGASNRATNAESLQENRHEVSYGGAENFQRFIAEELIPLIDRQYQTLPGERTYFGHSAAGSFGLFTLFTRAEIFKNYIISSPGLSFSGVTSTGVHHDNYEFMIQMTKRFISSGHSLFEKRLYMSAGGDEEFEPDIAYAQLTSSVYRMAALLKFSPIPGLQFTAEIFPGETHATVGPTAFIRGIQTVLGAGSERSKFSPTSALVRNHFVRNKLTVSTACSLLSHNHQSPRIPLAYGANHSTT